MLRHREAGYPCLWVATTEEERFVRENRKVFPHDIQFFRWDIADGLRAFVNPNGDENMFTWKTLDEDLQHPVPALRSIAELPGAVLDENNEPHGGSVIFMHDFHEFLREVDVQRCLLNMKDHLKNTGKMIVFLSHGVEIPLAVQDSIKILEFNLPDEAELSALLSKFCNDYGLGVHGNHIVDAMKGLTLEGAENAMALSLAETGTLAYEVILDAKATMLQATGYLQMMDYRETFDDLYGLEYIKEYAPACIDSGKGEGILLYGYPGTGKSHFSKALAHYCKLPCLSLDMSALRGSLVGETETNTRDAFGRIEAFGKSVVFVDEMGKSFVGMESSGQTDGGVNNRVGQFFLKYWEDREPGAYYVGTTNELEPFLEWSGGAMMSRFDAIFFLDMPTPSECKGIAKIWSEKVGVDIPGNLDFDGWTGRDIKKLAHTMDMMGVCAEKALSFIVPTAKRLGTGMAAIRKQAQNVCIPASKSEIAYSVRKIKVAK